MTSVKLYGLHPAARWGGYIDFGKQDFEIRWARCEQFNSNFPKIEYTRQKTERMLGGKQEHLYCIGFRDQGSCQVWNRPNALLLRLES